MTISRSETEAAAETTVQEPAVLALEAQSDDELRATIMRAKTLLASRKEERQAQALAMVRRLVKEHDLDLAVRKKRGKPGRPRLWRQRNSWNCGRPSV